MKDEELLCTLVLARTPGIGPISAHNLLNAAGSAANIIRHAKELTKDIPGFTLKQAESMNDPNVVRLCEAELLFAEKNGIKCLIPSGEDYPSRLRECPDAPLVLFYKGNADLNSLHIISIVGTRNATDYGKGICGDFLEELKALIPDAVIVSGLAYGIDIHAHRAALRNGLPTVGVLAHGLDRIYPPAHRNTAVEMISAMRRLSSNRPSKAVRSSRQTSPEAISGIASPFRDASTTLIPPDATNSSGKTKQCCCKTRKNLSKPCVGMRKTKSQQRYSASSFPTYLPMKNLWSACCANNRTDSKSIRW